MSSIAKFRVFGRVRPFIDSEIEGKATGEIRSIVEMTGNRTVLLDPKDNYSPKAQFEFDDSLWSIPTDYKFLHVYAENTKKEFASQLYVYNLVAKACPEDAFNGINSTIMTYGQTGGGKTYTMMGKYDPFSVCGGEGEEGIIPRVCHDVFLLVEAKRKEIEKLKDEDRWDIAVEVTFVEIYMEKVRDLLDRQAARTGEMREARIRVDTSGPFVEDVTKYRVSNWKHCCTLLEQGSSMRTTSANVVHQQSSRSHAIFTLTIVQNKTIPAKDKYSLPTVETKVGRINLVDLAGSERGGFTDYVKESSKINTSLLSLRRVIDTLVERQRIMMEQVSAEISGVPIRGPPQQPPAVPYRDSVLTWLLSDSMGGNARTTMVAALSPHEKNFNDTLATLQWSSKARNLVGVVKVNDSQSNVQSGMLGKRTDLQSSIHQHRQSVDALRQELESAKIGAAEYHRKALALKKEYLAQLSQLGNVKETAAAVMVQLALRKSLHRARVNKLQSQLKQGLTAIADKEAALVAATAAAAAATAALVASEAEIGVLSADVASKVARVETYNADEAAFSVKYEEAQMLRREGEVAVNQRRDELASIAQQIDADHKAALATVATARERHDSDTKKLAALQAEIAAVSQEDQDRWKREAEELEAANSKKEQERVAPLRKRKDELLAQKKDLQAKIDAKKKK